MLGEMSLAARKPLPRLSVDFNELLESDLILLSREDTRKDENDNLIRMHEGMEVLIFDEDVDDAGRPDRLIALGVVERNKDTGWSRHVKWCCRINSDGIRHESEIDGD